MTRTRQMLALLGFALGGALATSSQAEAPRLSLPVECEPGVTCFIQHYVDIDTGPEARDLACGDATYDTHDGVDIRLLSAAAARRGVRVLAAADGTVKGMRDGMQDAFPREVGRAGLEGRECGNGVVIDHGSGWETQYCHMRLGSVRVKTGAAVSRGDHLGDVGYSGLADMAHLHLTVRHERKAIDPFTGKSQDGTCTPGAALTGGLWADQAANAFKYMNGEIIAAEFADRAPGWAELEVDHQVPRPGATSDKLIFYARLINLRGGDRIRLRVVGPGGFNAEQLSEPIEGRKAIFASFVGKRLTAPRWAPGRYEGQAQIMRDGQVAAVRRTILTID